MVGIPLPLRTAMPRFRTLACALLITLSFAITAHAEPSAPGLSAQERQIAAAAEAGKEDAWSAFGYQAALVEKKRRHL